MPTLLELTRRAAALAPTTFDEKANTVEAVVSTGADVRRPGYIERLPVANADLRGFVGKPVLDAHSQSSTRAVLGVVEKAWIADGEIRVRIKLSSRDDVTGTVRDIRDGIIRSLSVGYQVLEWAESTNSKGERVRTARAWIPHEVSFVPIPADPGAVTRSSTVEPEIETPETPAPTEAEVRVQTRSEIRDIIKRAGGTPEQADELIDRDATPEMARAAAYELITARTQRTATIRASVGPSNDDPAAIMERRVGALYARTTGAKPDDASRQFMGDRLVDHARAFMVARGQSVIGLSDFDLLTRAHGVSDFPNLLDGVGNRVLLESFEAAQTPLLRLGRTATAPDFRPLNRLRISEMGAFETLTEHGELKNVSRSEIADAYAIESAGAIFALSFKSQVNDDLSAFADWSRAMAQQAAQRQKLQIVALLESNPDMEDSVALFDAAHGNLAALPSSIVGSGDDPVAPLHEARFSMRKQRGLDGVTALNLRPAFLVVSAYLETDAQRALAEVAAMATGDVNPFSGSMELLVESSLRSGDWYVFASPSAAPVFEHAWLQGFQGPQLASQENFRTLAREYRAVMHWGCGVLPGGWRGAFANFGSELFDSNSPV